MKIISHILNPPSKPDAKPSAHPNSELPGCPWGFFLIGSMISPTVMEQIQFSDFEKVDLRIGTIVKCETFPEARKPAYKLWIDLGADVGIKKSSAQITTHYTPETLLGKQVLCVVNFPPRQVGPFISEVLTTGFYDLSGQVVLATPDKSVPNGTRLV